MRIRAIRRTFRVQEIALPLRLGAFALSLFSLILASCAGPQPVPVTETPSPAATAISHAPEIRFALVGQPTAVNVWSLFDDSGASYANYAVHSDEYPTLYRLSIPAREFEAYTADGMPSIVSQEGDFLVASVKLQPGLSWSDASPLTAGDVAFTVNTALAFHLGLDWLSAYNPDLLDHAEAVDDATLKFFFKGPFNVGDWQYGALQGPIVNQAYWSPRVEAAVALLPAEELVTALSAAQAGAAVLQSRIDADNAQLLTTLPNTTTYSELSTRVVRNQNELNSVNSRLGELQDEYDAALNAARTALFALVDDGEPTFGPFLRAVEEGDKYTRTVNPNYPFEQPNFDRAVYRIFEDELSAIPLIKSGELHAILSPQPLPMRVYQREFEEDPALNKTGNSSSTVHFVAINPRRHALADPAFREVLFCEITDVPGRILTARSFVPEGNPFWHNLIPDDHCGAQASFPPITLITLPEEDDAIRGETAAFMEQSARDLGLQLSVKYVSSEELRYAIFSSGEYDLAIIRYRLSAYPGYLCEWFQQPGAFAYASERLSAACATMGSTADLETARQAAFEVQSILMEDLPLIPLYQEWEFEAYHGIDYPFDDLLDGISAVYGAPALAMPAP